MQHKTVIIVNRCIVAHTDNKTKKDFLVLGEEPSNDINGNTGAAQ